MSTRRARFGPYIYTADLGTLCIAPDCAFTRWASVHELTGSSHLVYHLQAPARDKFTIRRFLNAAAAAVGGCGPHALGIAAYALHPSGTACLVTPYPGDLGGVTTLRQLARAKGGRLSANEVVRATEHLIDALASGEQQGKFHGHFDLDGCVVDRAGRVAIELFGFPPRWQRCADNADRLQHSQRAALANIVRELFADEAGTRESSKSWIRILDNSSSPPVPWSDVRALLPHAHASSSAPSSSIVRTIWDKVKQLATRG